MFRTPLDPLQFEDFVNSSFAQLTYTMSKMKGLVLNGQMHGVRVNCVC